jgi:DNA-binding transcriptional LysR family regulator
MTSHSTRPRLARGWPASNRGCPALSSAPAKLEFVPLFAESVCAGVSLDHPLPNLKRLRLKQLLSETLLLPARHQAPLYNPWILSLFARERLTLEQVVEHDNAFTIVNAAAAGLCVALFPKQVGRLFERSLRWIPLAAKGAKYQHGLVMNRNESKREVVSFVAIARSGIGVMK